MSYFSSEEVRESLAEFARKIVVSALLLSQSDLANQRRAEPTRADFAEGLSRKSRKYRNFASRHHLKVDVYKL